MKKTLAATVLAAASTLTFTPAGTTSWEREVRNFAITIQERSEGRWAVLHMGRVWNGEGWEFDGMPSGRTEEHLAKCRFSLEEAVAIAQTQVDLTVVNGGTWAQWQAKWAALDAAETD